MLRAEPGGEKRIKDAKLADLGVQGYLKENASLEAGVIDRSVSERGRRPWLGSDSLDPVALALGSPFVCTQTPHSATRTHSTTAAMITQALAPANQKR